MRAGSAAVAPVLELLLLCGGSNGRALLRAAIGVLDGGLLFTNAARRRRRDPDDWVRVGARQPARVKRHLRATKKERHRAKAGRNARRALIGTARPARAMRQAHGRPSVLRDGAGRADASPPQVPPHSHPDWTCTTAAHGGPTAVQVCRRRRRHVPLSAPPAARRQLHRVRVRVPPSHALPRHLQEHARPAGRRLSSLSCADPRGRARTRGRSAGGHPVRRGRPDHDGLIVLFQLPLLVDDGERLVDVELQDAPSVEVGAAMTRLVDGARLHRRVLDALAVDPIDRLFQVLRHDKGVAKAISEHVDEPAAHFLSLDARQLLCFQMTCSSPSTCMYLSPSNAPPPSAASSASRASVARCGFCIRM
mmetsp:Transcript_23471/g.62014  ORF Transcript_23471/g.62014 Transcript_23471/m.62014 type:complete len:364 (-) Transcript_23471:502-1593(-)